MGRMQMNRCYFCYRQVPQWQHYHKSCSKKFFGTDSLPVLELNKELLEELAKETINRRISITGVQPKLSVNLDRVPGQSERLTIVGLWGAYILKPQHAEIPQMPETEDLTMHLASVFKIQTSAHCLIPTTAGQLVYLVKRFDRQGDLKIHMEDLCQLGEFQTEQKYMSTYERCGRLILKYCTNKGLDVLSYFELLVFSFLSGNNDMHMKNFAVLHQDGQIVLSPAYDLINSNLINRADKEDMALLLNGRKKNIKRDDFQKLSEVLGIREIVFERIMQKYTGSTEKVKDLIDRSFLSDPYKEEYKRIWQQKLTKLI